MNKEEKNLFACLGICASEGFTQKIAQVVSERENIRELAHLCSLSLVNQHTETDWYALHPLLSLFAREKAVQLKLLDTAEKRHSDYYCQFVQRYKDNMDVLERELDALHRLQPPNAREYVQTLGIEDGQL